MSDRTVSRKVEIEVLVSELHNIEFTRISTIVVDGNYGADADGNRGVSATFVEEDYYEDVYVDGNDISTYPQLFQTAIDLAIQAWLDSNEVIE